MSNDQNTEVKEQNKDNVENTINSNVLGGADNRQLPVLVETDKNGTPIQEDAEKQGRGVWAYGRWLAFGLVAIVSGCIVRQCGDQYPWLYLIAEHIPLKHGHIFKYVSGLMVVQLLIGYGMRGHIEKLCFLKKIGNCAFNSIHLFVFFSIGFLYLEIYQQIHLVRTWLFAMAYVFFYVLIVIVKVFPGKKFWGMSVNLMAAIILCSVIATWFD